MLIDPITVLAQIVNFLLLVLLLKHFLYGPITRAMAQRERTIAEQLMGAEQQEALAQQEAARLAQMQQDFAAHRDQRLAQLRSELDEQRLTLLKQAEAEVNATKRRWYRSLDQQKATVLRSFQQQAIAVLTQTLRQALKDLATVQLERQVVETFLERLETMPESEQQILQTALHQSPARICSSFPLEAAAQQAVTAALRRLCKQPTEPTFEVDPALGCGIVVSVAGHTLGWNLAAYLNDVERRIAALDSPTNTDSIPLSA
ncbi:MAG: F0F1 ATP synthase subunit delta [Elainellaceae cyanobacterium]